MGVPVVSAVLKYMFSLCLSSVNSVFIGDTRTKSHLAKPGFTRIRIRLTALHFFPAGHYVEVRTNIGEKKGKVCHTEREA